MCVSIDFSDDSRFSAHKYTWFCSYNIYFVAHTDKQAGRKNWNAFPCKRQLLASSRDLGWFYFWMDPVVPICCRCLMCTSLFSHSYTQTQTILFGKTHFFSSSRSKHRTLESRTASKTFFSILTSVSLPYFSLILYFKEFYCQEDSSLLPQ